VERDAVAAQRTRMLDAAYARLRERYEIVIERPRDDVVAR
jgi:hypothetical protein